MNSLPSPSGKVAPTPLLDEPKPREWFQRRRLWFALAALALAGAVLWYWTDRRFAASKPVYMTQPVTRGDLTLTITANGTLQPTRAINIGSELSGTVLKVNVDVNDRIKRGQVLLVLDTAKLRDQVQRSEATLRAARSKVVLTSATVSETLTALARLDEVARLSDGRVPAKSELDAARASLARARAEAGSAQAGVSDAQASLSTDNINLSKASIAAPADGVILVRNVDPGNAVAASLQAVTLFVVAEDLSRLRLWVYVDEADVGAVRVGQAASFTVSAYLSRNYPATITRVGFGSTITDNVVTYLTYLDVDNRDMSLRPGMTATASITAMHRHDVLLVPNSALRFTPTTPAPVEAHKAGIASSLIPRMPGNPRKPAASGANSSAAKQVWVVHDGVTSPVAVIQGISDGHMTEIVGGQLVAGMQVITGQRTASAK